jgi:hypothetical protein
MESAVLRTKKQTATSATEDVSCHVTHFTTTDLGSETFYYSGFSSGNTPIKYTDPDGRAGSFPDDTLASDSKLAKELNLAGSRITYVAAGLPERGPCLMRALIGIAETFTGRNIGKAQLKSLMKDLITGTNPLVDVSAGCLVQNSGKIIKKSIDAILGDGKSENYNVIISQHGDSNYKSVKAKAMFSLLAVGARSDSSVAGHWQEGSGNGDFFCDPLSGKDGGGRSIFKNDTRYIIITPKNEE